MKPPKTLPFCGICGKTPAQRYQFQWPKSIRNRLRQAAIIRARWALRVASSVSILVAQVFASHGFATPFRAIATASTSPKNPLSSVTSASQPFFLERQTRLDLALSPNVSQHQSFYPERIASGGSASALNSRGLDLMQQGRYAAAQALFTQALEINPRYAPAYNNRAMIHILLGEETAAVQDYSLSLTLNPSDGDVYYNRGLAYATLDNSSAAIADYTKALQLNPRNAQAYHARGGVYLSLNNRAMARSDFQIAVALYRQQGYQEEYSGLQEFLNQF
jgi:tetratricopeptide (TPR) repeat protein